MINNPTEKLKVPYGLYKVANDNNILREVLLWYHMKSFNTEGVLKRGKKISLIQSRTGLSIPRINQLLKNLEDLSFIKRNKGNIYLCSYNFLWKELGFELERIRLLRINAKDKNNDLLIFRREIDHTLWKIKKEIPKGYLKYLRDTGDLHPDTAVKNKQINKIFNPKKAKKAYYESIRKGLTSISPYCSEATLTCRKIADMFGYSSAMMGYHIQQKLKNKGLINIINNRCIYISNDTHYHRTVLEHTGDTSFYSYNNHIYKQLPNIIIT